MTQSVDKSPVSEWLENIGFSKYEELFRLNEIDYEVLADLTNEDFRELEIPIGDRKKLLKAISLLAGTQLPGTQQQPSNSSVTTAITGSSAPQTPSRDDQASTADVELRQITVLFCDLTGSTEMSNRLDMEDLANILRDFQKTCADIVERGGGFLARYQGDAVMAYFGWPHAHEDDAERSVSTGLEMVQAIGQMQASDGSPLLARVGIATGMVMVGELIGEGLSQEKSVVGATPNLAARLESLAQPGEVAISAATARLIGDLFKLKDIGVHQLKGFPEPEQVWSVGTAREITSRFGVRLRKGLTPLVGRSAEAEVLNKLWAKVVQGDGQVAMVLGEAGIGKSRLVRSLEGIQKDSNHTQITYQCHAFRLNSALHPIIEQIGLKADIQPSNSAAVKLKKLETLLASRGLATPESVPLVASLLSINWEGYYPPLNLSPQLQGQKVIDLIIDLMTWRQPNTALELIFEDVHWADPTTLQVINKLLPMVANQSILLVITYRPEYAANWPDMPNLTLLDLRRLSPRQVKAMVKRVANNKVLPEEVMESIASTTDGVPLFVEELTKTIIESGQLREENESYQIQGTELDISIPASLRDSLAARLDQLTVGRELAQVGATIGRTFSAQLAAYILHVSDIELREPLAHLCEAGIIERRGRHKHGQFFFKHALFQEAAYRSQLKKKRREMHLQIATAMESHFPDVAEEQPDTLARHFEEAGSTAKAIDYLMLAGKKSMHVTAIDEAIAHLSQGVDLSSTLPQSASRDLMILRLQASLGTSYMLGKGWAAPEVELAYSEANKVSHAANDAAEAIWILWGIWVYRHARGQVSHSIPISDRIVATAGESPEPRLTLIADMVELQVGFYSGHFETAIEKCLAVETQFVPSRDRDLINLYSIDLELVALVHHSIACWIQGQFAEAQEINRSARDLARKLKHPYSLSWALLWGEIPGLLHDHTENSAKHIAEGIAIARKQGFAYVEAMGNTFSGWLDGQRGELNSGIAKMQDGLASFRGTGAEIAIPFFNTMLADLHRQAGNTDEALDLLQLSQQQVETWGECWQESEIHRVRGEVLASASSPDHGAAHESFQRAIDIAAQQNAKGWGLRSALGLAQLQLTQNNPAAAYETLSPALNSLDETSSASDYQAAKVLLEKISNSKNVGT